MNKAGADLLSFCALNEMIIMNTAFVCWLIQLVLWCCHYKRFLFRLLSVVVRKASRLYCSEFAYPQCQFICALEAEQSCF